MRQPRNLELRILIKEANLYLWQVAEEMQIHESTLYRILRHNLSDEQREKILHAIDDLKNK